jgi:hypothetical protein
MYEPILNWSTRKNKKLNKYIVIWTPEHPKSFDGGWYYEHRSLEQGNIVTKKLQKIVRYYVTKSGTKIVKCHPDGREMQVEAGQWMQKVVNKIDPSIPYDHYDIDIDYYLENIEKQIEQINKFKVSSSTQLTLF